MKLEKIAFELIKDLNNKFPRYNAKRISDFNKLVKHFKSKMPKVSNIKLGQIALDYHNYREKGDMGVKIPTIKKMAHTMKKIGMKEQKMSDKQQYDYLVYMRKYKPDIWRDLQGNKKVKNIMKKFESKNEGLDDLKALPKDLKKSIKKNRNESVDEARGTCWVGYKQLGMKDKGGKKVPNCVKEIIEIFYESDGKGYGYTFEHIKDLSLTEAEYQGRKVKLGKIMQGDQKKFKVYVKNPKGNVVKVNFGQGGKAKGGTMKIRKSNPAARRSFRARHNCDNPGPRHKARYWSCRKW